MRLKIFSADGSHFAQKEMIELPSFIQDEIPLRISHTVPVVSYSLLLDIFDQSSYVILCYVKLG